MIVTEEMKEAGSLVLFRELGFQYSPPDTDLDELAEAVFTAMYALHNAKERAMLGEVAELLHEAALIGQSYNQTAREIYDDILGRQIAEHEE